MRVALDVSCLASDRASGLRTYTENLVRHLAPLCAEPPLLWINRWRAPVRPLEEFPHTRRRVVLCPRRLLEWSWRWLGLPSLERLAPGVQVFHSLHVLVPPRRRTAVVLTVHDLREFRLPHLYPGRRRWRLYRAAMARRAQRVIAVSEHTRVDAVELLGVDPARIRVIPHGLDPSWLDPLPPPRDGPAYAVFLSNPDPRKGLEDALEAFGRAAVPGLRLAVVGAPPGGRWPALPAGADRLGSLGDQELRGLLAGARALLFPSYYEGFGLPLVEAFALGVPVVAYANSSIPEVAGDAAWLVPTGDRAALAEGLRAVTEQPEPWVSRGRRRCRLFCWKRAAAQVLEVYREAWAD